MLDIRKELRISTREQKKLTAEQKRQQKKTKTKIVSEGQLIRDAINLTY